MSSTEGGPISCVVGNVEHGGNLCWRFFLWSVNLSIYKGSVVPHGIVIYLEFDLSGVCVRRDILTTKKEFKSPG
jgi:hypothetical protein